MRYLIVYLAVALPAIASTRALLAGAGRAEKNDLKLFNLGNILLTPIPDNCRNQNAHIENKAINTGGDS